MGIRYRIRIRKNGKYNLFEKIIDGKIVGTKSLNLPKLWVLLGGNNDVEKNNKKKMEKFTKGKNKKKGLKFAQELLDEPCDDDYPDIKYERNIWKNLDQE